MCDCIETLDEKLKPEGQCVNATILANPRRCLVDLIRTDKWAPENRRNKSKALIATYCPMCGEKYEVAPTLAVREGV